MRGKLLTVWWPQNKGRHYVHWICNGIVLRLLGARGELFTICVYVPIWPWNFLSSTYTHTRELELRISLGLFHFLYSISDWLPLSCHRPSLDTERLSVRSGSSCNYFFKVGSVYLCWSLLYEASLIKPSEVNPLFPNLWEAFDSPSLLSPLLSVEPWAMVPHRNQEKNNVSASMLFSFIYSIYVNRVSTLCCAPCYSLETWWRVIEPGREAEEILHKYTILIKGRVIWKKEIQWYVII